MSQHTVVRGGPDWWSRWMALGSLAVAGAALFYTYKLHSSMQAAALQADATIPTAATADEMMTSNGNVSPGNTADEPSVAGRTADSSSALGPEDRDPISWDDPIDNTETSGSQPEADSMMAERSSGGDATITDTTNESTDPLETPIEQPTVQAPRLAEVRTTFRPNGQPESITTTITNAGGGEAKIYELLFRPKEVVELPIEASRPDWGDTDQSHLVLFFKDADNRTSTHGKHGEYGRELISPFTLAAGESVDINLAIQNSDHTGYGLRGRLTLRMRNGEDYDIEEATLAFVGQ